MNKKARWTLLGVDEDAIKAAKRYARKNGYQLGKAVSKIILERKGK